MGRKKRPDRPGDEIKVGNRVRLQMPGGPWEAVVVDDYGDIGVNGRRLVSVRPFITAVPDPEPFDWPAVELTLVE